MAAKIQISISRTKSHDQNLKKKKKKPLAYIVEMHCDILSIVKV